MSDLFSTETVSKSKTVYDENQKLRIQTIFGQNNNNNQKNKQDYLMNLRKSRRKDNLNDHRPLD